MFNLITAVKKSDYARIKTLLEAGENVNQTDPSDPFQGSALYWSVCSSDEHIFTLLLLQGADVKKGNKERSTPLHASADLGNYLISQQLIQSGAIVNAKNNKGNTPMHLAAYRGHRDICQLLLQANADVTILNNSYRTPREEAQRRQHESIVRLLLKWESQGATLETLHPAMCLTDMDTIRRPTEHLITVPSRPHTEPMVLLPRTSSPIVHRSAASDALPPKRNTASVHTYQQAMQKEDTYYDNSAMDKDAAWGQTYRNGNADKTIAITSNAGYKGDRQMQRIDHMEYHGKRKNSNVDPIFFPSCDNIRNQASHYKQDSSKCDKTQKQLDTLSVNQASHRRMYEIPPAPSVPVASTNPLYYSNLTTRNVSASITAATSDSNSSALFTQNTSSPAPFYKSRSDSSHSSTSSNLNLKSDSSDEELSHFSLKASRTFDNEMHCVSDKKSASDMEPCYPPDYFQVPNDTVGFYRQGSKEIVEQISTYQPQEAAYQEDHAARPYAEDWLEKHNAYLGNHNEPNSNSFSLFHRTEQGSLGLPTNGSSDQNKCVADLPGSFAAFPTGSNETRLKFLQNDVNYFPAQSSSFSHHAAPILPDPTQEKSQVLQLEKDNCQCCKHCLYHIKLAQPPSPPQLNPLTQYRTAMSESPSQSSSSRTHQAQELADQFAPLASETTHSNLYHTLLPLFKVIGQDFRQAMTLTLTDNVKGLWPHQHHESVQGNPWTAGKDFIIIDRFSSEQCGASDIFTILYNDEKYYMKISQPVLHQASATSSGLHCYAEPVRVHSLRSEGAPHLHAWGLSLPPPKAAASASVYVRYPTSLHQLLESATATMSLPESFLLCCAYQVLHACITQQNNTVSTHTVFLDSSLMVKVIYKQALQDVDWRCIQQMWTALLKYCSHRHSYSGKFLQILQALILATDFNTLSNCFTQVGILLFGPTVSEVKLDTDCEVWLQSKMMKLLVHPPVHTQPPPNGAVLTILASIKQNLPLLELDFVTMVTGHQVWQNICTMNAA